MYVFSEHAGSRLTEITILFIAEPAPFGNLIDSPQAVLILLEVYNRYRLPLRNLSDPDSKVLPQSIPAR